jgi:hypothetical protein
VNQQEHKEFTGLLHRYEEVLQDESLTAAERANYKGMRDKVEDALLQDWLPTGLFRRAITMALVATGLLGLLKGSDVSPWVE